MRLHFVDVPTEEQVQVGGPHDPAPAVPRCAPARAVVDASSWARSDRQATFIVISALQSGAASLKDVRAHLIDRTKVKRRSLLFQVLDDVGLGSESVGELDFLRLCRRFGLPEPRRQVARTDSKGRTRFVDAEFISLQGRIVMVEVDGVGHMDPTQWLADIDRHNELAVRSGALVLRVSTWQLRNDPVPFFERLRAVLMEGAMGTPVGHEP